jgi:pimeloyl-ACP methyl ester carboxylesterase
MQNVDGATTKFEDRYIDIGGIHTRYWQAGNQGSNVLLLHGIACSVLEWEHNIATLARSHRVFTVDLLGFGLTDKPAQETYSIRRLSQFVLDFLAAMGIGHAHFTGNSMGGRIALDCALIAPDHVDSLVLADPAGIDRHGVLRELRLATIPLLGEILTWPNRLGTRMLWRKAFADPAPFVTKDLISTKVALASQTGAHSAFLKTLRSFVDDKGFPPEQVSQLQDGLPDIQVPVLVVWGRNDRFISVSHAEVLQRLLPNVQVRIFDNCGHTPQIELADQFNKEVLDFWGTLEPR